MQISPIAAMEATLAQFVTSMTSQQELAAGPAAQPDNRMAATMQDVQNATKARKPQPGEQVAQTTQQEAQPPVANTGSSASSGKTGPTEPVVERQLFDYLIEIEKRGGSGSSDPSGLLKSALQSMGGMMEQAEKALGKALPNDQKGQEGVEAVSTEDATAQTGPAKASETKPAGTELEKMLEQYASVSWAFFGASLATNSVAAASSSVNTLIKQQ